MKKINILLPIFLMISVLFLSSCKKEEILQPNNTIVGNNTQYDILGIDWVLADGRFYSENMDNGDKYFYDHFGPSQTLSTLDPISGADVPFDTIVQDITVWNFGNSNFTLNGTNSYNFTHFDNIRT